MTPRRFWTAAAFVLAWFELGLTLLRLGDGVLPAVIAWRAGHEIAFAVIVLAVIHLIAWLDLLESPDDRVDERTRARLAQGDPR